MTTIIQNQLLLWFVAFAVGAGLGAAFYFVVLRGRTSKEPIARAPITDGDKKIYEQVTEIIDRKLTDKSLGLREIAGELGVAPPAIAKLFKRHTGQSFKMCLMRSRIEVAKERLRSSNCAESTVAETCGFHNSSEMVRCFWRFYRTTPAKYRMEQQVT